MCDLKYMDKKTHIIYLKSQIFLFFSEALLILKNSLLFCLYIYIYIYISVHLYLSIYLYTAHIVFIHIPSVAVKPVHIFMVRNRVCKNCLMAELCFHCFVHFDCISILWYTFWAITARSVLAIRSTSLLWCSPLSCSVLLMSP